MRQPAERSLDLVLTAAAALTSVLLALLPIGGVAQLVLLAPLVLLLPGYAIAAAMFPPGTITRAERLVYTVGLSIGAAVLGGLLWQLLPALDRFAWILILVLVTLVACVVAQRRRASATVQAARRPPLPRLGLATAAAMVVALGLAVVAINTATEGLEEQRGMSHFSTLWVAPHGGVGGSVEIGVANHRGAGRSFRLRVARGGVQLRSQRLRLGPHQERETIIGAAELPGRGSLVVTLYRDGVPYRRAELQTGGGT